MLDLVRAISDADVVLALPPEELAGKLLFLVRRRLERDRPIDNMFHPINWAMELLNPVGAQPRYPDGKVEQVARAVMEGFAWLEAQTLIVPPPSSNALNGMRILSRRAEAMHDVPDFEVYRAARLLPRELLHPSIAEPVWLSFVRGDYEIAALQAMRQVEIALRESAGDAAEVQGVKLARAAFNPATGPLTDPELEAGERQGMMDLFAGALGALKNPHSHRIVDFETPADAVSVVSLASHLLRIIDRRRSH